MRRAFFLLFLLTSLAHGQTLKVFVASYGNDSNDGSRGNPKRNFQAAHNVLAAAGQIIVLDTSGYGTLTITKPLSITVPPGVNGFVTAKSGNGIVINVSGDNATVALRGLIIESSAGSLEGGNGLAITQCTNVVIEDCTFRNWTTAILDTRTSDFPYLDVRRSNFRADQSAILCHPTGGSRLVGNVSDCAFDIVSSEGVYAYTDDVNTTCRISVSDSTFFGGGVGMDVYGAKSVEISNNNKFTGNFTAFDVAGGTLYTRGNNNLFNNIYNNMGSSTTSASGY